ncbi:diguanylate cyclase [Candidatus Halobeggiatoa sp. HSG11]|nr:diguanylate cyclase [Candidatus Halobeggiatoa sp. HSG11]
MKNILKNINLLYVEDEEETRNELSYFLNKKVGKLYTASNGKEGLEIFDKYKPDVIVTDIMMPVMDGLEMAQTIKEKSKNTPILLTTAFNESSYLIRSIEIGIDHYVQKPINPYDLTEKLVKSSVSMFHERELKIYSRYARFILDSMQVFIVATVGHEIEYINKAFLQFIGYNDFEDFKHLNSLDSIFTEINGVQVNFEEKSFEWIKQILMDEHDEQFVYLTSQQKHESKPYLVTVNRFPERNSAIFSFTEATKLTKERESLQIQATTDGLTGIYNRRKFESLLTKEIQKATRYETSLSLIMFDIDHFKKVNDTYGHQIGDYVLQELSRIVVNNIRRNDIFARWGGEEFMILVPNNNLENAAQLAEKLRGIIATSKFKNVPTITSSFGVVQFEKEESGENFVHRVDELLYSAKHNGRNRVETKV